jgi:hypothetical protein
MFQPEDCLGEPILEIAPAPPAHPGAPAAWFLLGFLIALVAFELWALHTGHNTVSQLLQHVLKGHKWLQWVAVVGWAVVGWHLFKGFPW